MVWFPADPDSPIFSMDDPFDHDVACATRIISPVFLLLLNENRLTIFS